MQACMHTHRRRRDHSLSGGLCAGWEDTRLLAPIAECTLYLASTSSILETERLAALGLVLRGLCCLEVRHAALAAQQPMSHTPQHIVPGTSVASVAVRTASGVQFPLVIGAPAQVRPPCCVLWICAALCFIADDCAIVVCRVGVGVVGMLSAGDLAATRLVLSCACVCVLRWRSDCV